MKAHRLMMVSGAAALLAGCGLGDFGISRTPPPALRPSPPPATSAGGTPSVDVAATPAIVRDILVARARSRGSQPTLTPQAVVIQRALPATNEALQAACGPHTPGRMVRVVLGTQAISTGTRLTEQRYIIDGPTVCPLALNAVDAAEAEASLNQVKQQAETRMARR